MSDQASNGGGKTRLETLREKYAVWDGKLIVLHDKERHFVNFLRQNFTEYLGATGSYQSIKSNLERGSVRNYVDFAKVEPLSADGTYTFHRKDNSVDAVTDKDKDGYIVFGIWTVIDRAANVHPKTYFSFRIAFRFSGSRNEVLIFDRKFECDTNDDHCYDPLLQHMYDMISNVLDAEPDDYAPAQKAPIGFLQGSS